MPGLSLIRGNKLGQRVAGQALFLKENLIKLQCSSSLPGTDESQFKADLTLPSLYVSERFRRALA